VESGNIAYLTQLDFFDRPGSIAMVKWITFLFSLPLALIFGTIAECSAVKIAGDINAKAAVRLLISRRRCLTRLRG